MSNQNKEIAIKGMSSLDRLENIALDSEDLEGVRLTFPRVKVPSGGSTAFEIPGEDPDNPEITKEIVGIIISKKISNAYFEHKYDGTANRPTCSSADGINGTRFFEDNKVEERRCISCPLNQFGSAEDGEGKACKNTRKLYILRENQILPIELVLPPTSIGSLSTYINGLAFKGLSLASIVTKVTLKKEQNSNNISYSKVQFSILRNLNPQEREKVQQYKKQVSTLIDSQHRSVNDIIDTNDYVVVESDELPF